MAESSPPRDSKKGKAIVLREEPRVEPDEQMSFSLRFDGLSNGSITCFHDFKTVFLRHFAGSQKYQKIDHCLFALKQGAAKPLRSYIKRFNQVAQDVPSATYEILISAFSHRLVEGEFFLDLIRDSMKNFNEMLGKTANYINVEEV
ncbi:uncharacterized protein LOC122044261 [Zingiber officinale]|uniref:uncharacterized protein LOC122044260 n=1 Tax=Zingiber officinale TaxID=94328 RepID=UPI001C4DCC8C|nr:uncharacterized protein LOC122044260 [Zingiber officinale]XP_042460712.1 uncharacterized protein LOC122044261 [Zingiber officinale]